MTLLELTRPVEHTIQLLFSTFLFFRSLVLIGSVYAAIR